VLGPQRSGDVLPKELPYFGDPRALGVVELEVHNGDTIGISTRQRSESDHKLSLGLLRPRPSRPLTRQWAVIVSPWKGRHLAATS
jgi:hypothetical protein